MPRPPKPRNRGLVPKFRVVICPICKQGRTVLTGQYLRLLREEAGYSLRQLGKKTNSAWSRCSDLEHERKVVDKRWTKIYLSLKKGTP